MLIGLLERVAYDVADFEETRRRPSICDETLGQAQRRREQAVNYFGNFSGLCALISGYCVPFVLFSETWLRNTRAKNARIYRGLLARPKRFELLTPRFVVWCSIQLSYGRGAS
jgi:hypothetical protein